MASTILRLLLLELSAARVSKWNCLANCTVVISKHINRKKCHTPVHCLVSVYSFFLIVLI